MFDQPQQPNNTPTYIYNPSKEDFTHTYANAENEPIEYTVPAGELQQYPYYLAQHLAKHLADKVMGDRGIRVNPEADHAAIMKEILVEL